MNRPVLNTLLLTSLLLSGCTMAQPSEPESAQLFESSAETLQTADSTSEPAESESKAETDPPETEESAAAEPAPEQPETEFHGGIGGEEHADTPLPEYFLYRFEPESVAVRLSGGNYQVIAYDFSAMFENGQQEHYDLRDCDGDGDLDLYVPVQFSGQQITQYAAFLWNADTEKFIEEPVLCDVPTDSVIEKENVDEQE